MNKPISDTFTIVFRVNDQLRKVHARGVKIEDVKGKTLMHLLEKYNSKVEIVSVEPFKEEIKEESGKEIWQQIADYTMDGNSHLYKCASPAKAEKLAELIEAEYRKAKVGSCFGTAVFGCEVQTFPVYHEMKGSIAWHERTQPDEESDGI